MSQQLQTPGVKSALFRVDAGSDIGIGHYKRCAAIAEYLEKYSEIDSIFLTKSNIVQDLNSEKNWPTIKIALDEPMEGELCIIRELVSDNDIGFMFADINNSNTTKGQYFSYLEQVKSTGLFIASFDDFRTCPTAPDLVIIPYAGADRMEVGEKGGTRYLLGPKYFILGTKFLEAREVQRNHRDRSIMVCLGGADVNNLTETIVADIIDATNDIHLNIVRGPCAAEWSPKFKKQLLDTKVSHNIYEAPDSLVQIMKNSTIGVFSSGLTPYEAAAVGLPSIVVSLNEYHQGLVDKFAETDAIISFGTFKYKDNKVALDQIVADLIDDDDRIDAMSARGQEAIDGLGIKRIVDEILNRIG
jgi:spore coat polysaccharide biosynthesis predicted glycosyltransferase SpsG